MTLQEFSESSNQLRRQYHQLEEKLHNTRWTREEDALAFLTDAALVGRWLMAKEGRWPSEQEKNLPDKIGECAWWLAVIAERSGIDFAAAAETFLLKTMQAMESEKE
ncbi:MAG: hypothetical protein MR585_09715 [Selenomonas bovis]|nr:hypothetical protein [Selenomonas bovis]